MGAQDQRPRFFEGQFLSADDLTAIIDYQRTGDARLALGAHTWGIALGLDLLEKAAPGAPNRVEAVLQPGFAWDGFGRPLAVARPTRLSESLFAEIPFQTTLDDPTNGTGRLVPVWLAYDEIANKNPAPGFATCVTDDQSSRIGEAFRFVIGKQPVSEQRSPVTIGTQSMDAEAALNAFDPAAGTLWDTSVPHQTFPGPGKPPRWLVPIGFVRWIARQNELGYFAKRDLKVDEHADGQIRAFRRHIGAVTERIEAAGGAIVLHDRFEDPQALHRYARLLGNPEKALSYRADLVWVEGNLRVGGDAKINGGMLHFRDADGEDKKTPLFVARFGDASPADGARELRIAIGDDNIKISPPIDKPQQDNKLVVGPMRAAAPGSPVDPHTQPLEPRLVVVSGSPSVATEGRVGVNTATPNAALEVKGDWSNDDGAVRLAGNQPTIRFEGGADVGNHKWIAQLTSQPSGTLKFAHRFGNGPWDGVLYATPKLRIGIGATDPRNPLAVRAQPGDPGWEELISLEDIGGATKWHVNLHAAGGGKHLNIAETGIEDGRLYLQAGGNIGMGTTNPEGRLTLSGKVQPGQGKLTFFSSQADVEYDGGADNVFIFHQTTPGVTAFLNTRLGVGSTSSAKPLAVRATGPGEELVSFETPGGVMKWHINQALVGSPRGLNFVESGVADGRLFLREGGNVGVGVTSPQEKLHVNGAFVRVDGRSNEQAYIGGDGLGGPDVQIGSFNPSVQQVHFWNLGSATWMQIWGTWYGPSDARLKRNIEPLSNSLDRVLALNGVSYEWRTDSDTLKPQRHLGLVAQDVQQIVPEVVVRSGRGDLGIDYQGLVSLLVGAVKELKAEVEVLRAELRRLPGAATPSKSRK